MPQPIPTETREQAHVLYMDGCSPLTIAERLNIKVCTVKAWIARKGWTMQQVAVAKRVQAAVSPIVEEMRIGVEQQVRGMLAREIHAQAKALADAPAPTLADLRSNPDREGRAKVANTVNSTASSFFGWDKSASAGQVITVGDLRCLEPEQVVDVTPENTQVIDVKQVPE